MTVALQVGPQGERRLVVLGRLVVPGVLFQPLEVGGYVAGQGFADDPCSRVTDAGQVLQAVLPGQLGQPCRDRSRR